MHRRTFLQAGATGLALSASVAICCGGRSSGNSKAGSSPAFTYTCSGTTSTVVAKRPVIGADYVAYNDTPNLARAIGMPESELCFTCSTGDYTSLGIKPVFRSRIEMKGE